MTFWLWVAAIAATVSVLALAFLWFVLLGGKMPGPQ